MRLLELIRRPFRARRLRRNRPPKALSLQDEAEAAWAEAEELQRRLSAEQEENRRQAIHLQQRELHSADVELVALRRALAVLASADYEAVYTLLSPELDPDGFHLFRAAEAYTGINIYSAFPVEDSLGYFEAMSGHELLRWPRLSAHTA